MITLACTECKQRNYRTSKNKNHNTERIELKKNTASFAKDTQFTGRLGNKNNYVRM